MALTTWKQLVQDCANALRTARGTSQKFQAGELATRINEMDEVLAETDKYESLVVQLRTVLESKGVVVPASVDDSE